MLHTSQEFQDKLHLFGVGRRTFDDELFKEDRPPPRLGIYDIEDENLCHEIVKSSCHIPGCPFESESLLEFENHYNATHRYSCSQCKKLLPSPHLLDLHIQETHDSFFAVMAVKKPSYCCYIEVCKEKFQNPEERLDHCIKIHKIPKDFRFDLVPKTKPKKGKNKKQNKPKEKDCMDVEVPEDKEKERAKKFSFANSKQRGVVKYSGKKFTNDDVSKTERDVDIDEAMDEMKQNLPDLMPL